MWSVCRRSSRTPITACPTKCGRCWRAGLFAEWQVLAEKIQQVNTYLLRKAQASEACQRLREIPGIGVQTATALVATIGNAEAFEKGRDVAAWLGLVPREYSSGGKQRLGGISKRGNRYVRTLLVHCARSSLDVLAKRSDQLGQWLRRMLLNKDRRVVIVALAARLARIAWALLSSGQRFSQQRQPAPAG